MTTGALAHDGPRRHPSAGRLGALAAVTPIVMYATWVAISGWGGTASSFMLVSVQIGFGAVAAGWIVGRHLGRSLASRLVGLVAYGFVAHLALLPILVAGSTWEDVGAGRASNVIGVVQAAGGYLLYGVISATYTLVFLVPFGAGWMVTFLLLRRVVER